MDPEVVAALVGAGGVVVGGLIAAGVAWRTSIRAERRARGESAELVSRMEVEREQALTMLKSQIDAQARDTAEREQRADARHIQSLSHERTRALTERYGRAAEQIGGDEPTVRLAGVYAMESVAEEWFEQRQQCVDVLCAYMRMPMREKPGEAVVRSAIGTVLSRRFRSKDVGEESWAGLSIDLRRAWFPFELDLSDAVFDGDVDFTGAEFAMKASFLRAQFVQGVNFDECVFESDAIFSQACFDGAATFRGMTVAGDWFASKSTFSSSPWFTRAVFEGDAVFDDSVLPGGAQFDNATFRDAAHFRRAAFGADAEFRESSFDGRASFEEASFGGNASFYGVASRTLLSLRWVRCHGVLAFNDADIAGEVALQGATLMRPTELDEMRRTAPGTVIYTPDGSRLELSALANLPPTTAGP